MIIQERADKKEKEKKAQIDKLMKDMNLAKGRTKKSSKDDDEDTEGESDLEPSYDGDGQILDPVRLNVHLSSSLYLSDHLLFYLFPLFRTQTRSVGKKMTCFHPLVLNLEPMVVLGQDHNNKIQKENPTHCSLL